jgi:hypothetical protein
MEKTNGQLWVSAQFSKAGKPVGDEDVSENMIQVDCFETTPAEVEAKMGLTINLGNYESLRVDVGVKMPCYKEEIEKAQALAFEIVERELFAKVKEAKSTL